MDDESSYILLIVFIVFLFFKKILAIIIEVKVPNYKYLNNAPPLWKNLVNLRRIFNAVDIIAISYFLINYKLNKYIRIIFALLLLISLKYFIIDERLIYNFIEDNAENNLITDAIIEKGDLYIDIFSLVFAIYALDRIFLK
jgi:hypothetical protein